MYCDRIYICIWWYHVGRGYSIREIVRYRLGEDKENQENIQKHYDNISTERVREYTKYKITCKKSIDA